MRLPRSERCPSKKCGRLQQLSIVACPVEIGAKSEGDRSVGRMIRERLGEAGGHVNHEIRHVTSYTVDPLREVQWCLDSPYLIVPVWRQNGCRIANCDPSDRDCRARGNSCSQMDNRVDTDFCIALNDRSVKDRRTRRDEHLILDRGADNMRHWPNQGVLAY